jgi:hypothetical protein
MNHHEGSDAPTENSEERNEAVAQGEPEAIPLGPETQAIIIQSIN